MRGRNSDYYSSVIEVEYYTDIDHAKLSHGMSEEEYEGYVVHLLKEASDYVEKYTNRDFKEEVLSRKLEKVPEGIHGIVRRIVGESLANTLARRDSVVMYKGDDTYLIKDEIFSKSIKSDLNFYKKRGRISIFLVGSQEEEVVEEEGVNYMDLEAGESLVRGSLVSVYNDEGMKVRNADAMVGNEAHGFIDRSVQVGEKVRVYLSGIVEIEEVEIGRKYYLSELGGVSLEVDMDEVSIRQYVGYGLSDGKMAFSLSESVGVKKDEK